MYRWFLDVESIYSFAVRNSMYALIHPNTQSEWQNMSCIIGGIHCCRCSSYHPIITQMSTNVYEWRLECVFHFVAAEDHWMLYSLLRIELYSVHHYMLAQFYIKLLQRVFEVQIYVVFVDPVEYFELWPNGKSWHPVDLAFVVCRLGRFVALTPRSWSNRVRTRSKQALHFYQAHFLRCLATVIFNREIAAHGNRNGLNAEID